MDMKFNQKKAVLSVLASFVISHFAFAEEPAPVVPLTVNGGKVTFNGEVTSGACAVSSEETDKIVTLDTVRATAFTAANQAGNAKKAFDLSLVDCDTSIRETVQVTFSGQAMDGNPNLLANTAGAGSAQNVGLQLYGPDGAALNLGELSSKVNLTGTTTIPLSVDYMSTAASVSAGKVQSVANFQLTYN
jgi:major type 1 subunit fimbrin (pilin)